VDVSKYFDWGFELDQGFLVFKYFLNLLYQELDHFNGEIDEWNILGVLRPVSHYVVVQVVDDHIHDEADLIVEVLLGHVGDALLELLAPFLLDIKGLAIILLRFQVAIKEHLELLPVLFLSKSELADGGQEPEVLFGDCVLFLVAF